MADIQKMIEQKEKLNQKIKEQKRKEHEKFGRWFFNKYKIHKSSEAKKFINEKIGDIDNAEVESYLNTSIDNNEIKSVEKHLE